MSQIPTGSHWLQTYSGGKFFPLHPRPDDIAIGDVAWALSNLCRFNGHTKAYYSVAEHSVHVSYNVPDYLALAGLMHDASEAYICDLPRPLKQVPEIRAVYEPIEDAIMQVIAKKFGFPYPLPREIKEADDALLATEALQLMSPLHPDWTDRYNPVPGLHLPCWSPREAFEIFLKRYYELTRFTLTMPTNSITVSPGYAS